MSESEPTPRDLPARPGMRASLVVGTAMFAMAQGISMERITARTGLRREDLADPDGWLPDAVMPALWRLLAEACPGRVVSLEMARVAPLSIFGPLTYASRHAKDLRTLLSDFIRYRIVMSDRLHMEMDEDEHESRVRIHHPVDALDGGLAAEMGLAIGARFGWEHMPDGCDGLVRVELAHAPNGPEEAYRAFFEVPVAFECPSNLLVFNTRDLQVAPKQTDPEMYRFIQDHLDAVHSRIVAEATASPIQRIRESVMRNAERSEYGAEALARSVGMSLRKLQRVVADHGLTVRTMLEEVREANARQLLGDSRLSVEEVSFLLGYSDDRAFRRAFKRWTGHTPAQVRRARRPRA